VLPANVADPVPLVVASDKVMGILFAVGITVACMVPVPGAIIHGNEERVTVGIGGTGA
jgi:hypothetical protein